MLFFMVFLIFLSWSGFISIGLSIGIMFLRVGSEGVGVYFIVVVVGDFVVNMWRSLSWVMMFCFLLILVISYILGVMGEG